MIDVHCHAHVRERQFRGEEVGVPKRTDPGAIPGIDRVQRLDRETDPQLRGFSRNSSDPITNLLVVFARGLPRSGPANQDDHRQSQCFGLFQAFTIVLDGSSPLFLRPAGEEPTPHQ